MLKPAHFFLSLIVIGAFIFLGRHSDAGTPSGLSSEGGSAAPYVWTKVTDSAGFGKSYNFPLFNHDGKMWSFMNDGCWYSEDGRTWKKSGLPSRKRDAYESVYAQLNGALYALGSNSGNYLDLKFGSRILRTLDFQKWETVSETSELPRRVFYNLIDFHGKLWLMGGYDGKKYYNDVWSSGDGSRWVRVSDSSPWKPRCGGGVVAFNQKLWLIGGGEINGVVYTDVWSSPDGVNWELATPRIADTPVWGYTTIAYDGKIWLIGANRNGPFRSEMLYSPDGVNWVPEKAPWPPRGGVAATVFENKLWITGGKYSYEENGGPKFVYYDDVWRMEPARPAAGKAPAESSVR
jgi:hypothetical protein